LTEKDIGNPRAQASLKKLSELNPYVDVSCLSGEIIPSTLCRYSVVVVIDQPLQKQIEIADFCHDNNIAVIVGDTRGVFGQIFCDFGDNFVIYDKNGEAATTCMIANISNNNPCLVTVLEDKKHNLEDGDSVELIGIEGMEVLNDKQYKVKVKDPYCFEIDIDTTDLPRYQRGGYAKQIKQTSTISFNKMSVSMEKPGDILCDVAKFDIAGPSHLSWR
jgi:ubiquitin-activating enzyme E1